MLSKIVQSHFLHTLTLFVNTQLPNCESCLHTKYQQVLLVLIPYSLLLSISSLPSMFYCSSSDPPWHFSYKITSAMKTALLLQFMQPLFKPLSTLQADLFKGISDIISPQFSNNNIPFLLGPNLHTSNSTEPLAVPTGMSPDLMQLVLAQTWPHFHNSSDRSSF